MRKIDANLAAHLAEAFAPLNTEAAAHAFPPTASLSMTLDRAIPTGVTMVVPHAKTLAITKMFTTAAVDMWMRGVHSFLISTSLTDVSPIWASVTGYYSSHYTVRSIAHLLGFFQLFNRKRIVRLEYANSSFVCAFDPKTSHDREHRFYWNVVKSNPLFAGDPFFTQNLPGDESDVSHRDRANYADHLPTFPAFRPLDAEAVKNRIERISDIEFKAPPIPRVSLYPDVESVQVIAYHRLVRFRDLVDAAVGTSNRFWRVHRDPPWARDFMDFQLIEEPTLRAEFTL
ncbi:MAG TPA: hypothetical protein VKR60_01090 [Candidatus Sulfotelmatobacter sp.]|nr:hypothetical protein [Candidatus Sulfotelmatobacter sp.]